MARQVNNNQSRSGASSVPQQTDTSVANGFKAGVEQSAHDSIDPKKVPGLSGTSIKYNISSRVWGNFCKCP